MPAMVLGLFTVGTVLRFTRASVLEVINNDYVRAARAKGLSEWTVIRRHVMRPALLSIATVAGLAFGNLLSGTVLVENIFSWPGIGRLTVSAISNRDYALVQGCILAVGLTYVLVNLLTDVLYTVANPRIRS